jgi:hypothetical protein
MLRASNFAGTTTSDVVKEKDMPKDQDALDQAIRATFGELDPDQHQAKRTELVKFMEKYAIPQTQDPIEYRLRRSPRKADPEPDQAD